MGRRTILERFENMLDEIQWITGRNIPFSVHFPDSYSIVEALNVSEKIGAEKICFADLQSIGFTENEVARNSRTKRWLERKGLITHFDFGCSNKGVHTLPSPDGSIRKELSIVWRGTVSDTNSFHLTDFLDCLYDVSAGKTVIHAIDACSTDITTFSKYSSSIEIITHNGTDIAGKAQIIKNADLCIAEGPDSILPSMLGTIVAVRPSSGGRLRNDRYILSYDLNNELIVSPESLRKYMGCTLSIEELLQNVSDEACGNQMSQLCKDRFVGIFDSIVNAIERSSTSRLKLLLHPCIFTDYTMYRTYSRLTGGTSADYDRLMHKRDRQDNMDLRHAGLPVATPVFDEDEFQKVQRSYISKIEAIRNSEGKIRVGFFVTFKETFTTRPIFESMIDDDDFDPFIVVTPNVFRSMSYQNRSYEDAYDNMFRRYGDRVIGGYDLETCEYRYFADEFQIIFFNNPYDIYDHPLHNVKQYLDRCVLPIYVNYAFPVLKFWDEIIKLDFYNLMWKVTIDTAGNMEYMKNVEQIGGSNGLVTGYVKMDKLITETHKSVRKTVIIAPHHTVEDWSKLSLSNFLKYSDLFLRLPGMYPEIDFVFRPHPLLFTNLKQLGFWTESQIRDYLTRIDDIPNMIYDTSDYYFDKFADSDGIIHDCGSFIAEYLYTRKPCCFMVKNENTIGDFILPFGTRCLDNYYKAYDEGEIISFIENVIIKGDDPLAEARGRFASEELMVNYPDASGYVIEYLRKTLRRCRLDMYSCPPSII